MSLLALFSLVLAARGPAATSTPQPPTEVVAAASLPDLGGRADGYEADPRLKPLEHIRPDRFAGGASCAIARAY
jgi:hypothetical protein